MTEISDIDTVKVLTEQPIVVLNRPAGYTPVRNLKGTLNVAVLLPLYLKENSSRVYVDSSKVVKGKKIPRIVNRPEEWIYYQSPDFIEMYEGILLATDTLRALGLNINIHIFDTKGDTVELTKLIRSGELADMNLFIGPVYSSNLAIMTEYAGNMGIPVVSPLQLINDSALVDNPNLFLASSSLEIPQKAIARKVGEFYDDNFVFIHVDSAGVDPEVRRFKATIVNELSNRLPFEEIKFKEFLFYSRSAFDNDSINRLGHALSAKTDNIIIIATEEGPVISETLQEIHALSKKFPLKVFGYPVIRNLDNLEPKFIFDLNILVYSPYWIDYSRRDVKKFNDDFRKKFLTEPSEMSYAWLGYDITYYFLSGLAIHGKDFISHPEMHNPDLLQTEFDFIRKRINDGFENQKLFPVRYSKDYEIKLESEIVSEQ